MQAPGVDFAAVFEALSTPHLVLDADLRVRAVNRAYESATGRRRAELLDRPLLDAFPDGPDGPGGEAVANLAASLERVVSTCRADTMPLQRYDVPVPGGRSLPRWWSTVNAPVRDAAGRVLLVVHRVEDVTGYVLERLRRDPGAQPYGTREDLEHAEEDVYARGQELRAALNAEAAASRRLAGLVEVAVQLAGARSVAELTDIVVGRGLGVLGAGGGAVAVRTGPGTRGGAGTGGSTRGGAGEAPGSRGEDVLELTMTSSLGERARRTFERLPLDSPLPVCVAAATGRTVVLPDRAASLAWTPQMAEAVESTGLGTWVSVPLRAAGRSVGALTIGWREPQDFTERDLELVHAFAAQCAQTLAALQAREQERRLASEQRRLSEALQRSLLTEPFQPDHLQIGVRYLPAAAGAHVGGDWYDCFLAPPGTTTLVVGDVAGHDRDAAAVMGQVRNLLRGIAAVLGAQPAAVLAGLDRAMQQLGVGAYATAVVAQVEQTPAERAAGLRTLRWSNAGHPPPVLVTPRGGARLLESAPDLLLGVVPGAARSDHRVVLEPGATAVLYTDGLVERRGVDVRRGVEWLRSTLEELAHLPVEALCDALLERLDASHEDDIALLVLRAHPEDRPRPAEAGPQVLPPGPPA
ncbi:SpoIIE family protein phosphatase [Kineococcus gypseus]|uniref:PP2C family protein-serine/threonine phosphatase n=1 Tax=Kineococcus gypseus TaxID=1637102 RepID=UPI003D7E4FE5